MTKLIQVVVSTKNGTNYVLSNRENLPFVLYSLPFSILISGRIPVNINEISGVSLIYPDLTSNYSVNIRYAVKLTESSEYSISSDEGAKTITVGSMEITYSRAGSRALASSNESSWEISGGGPGSASVYGSLLVALAAGALAGLASYIIFRH